LTGRATDRGEGDPGRRSLSTAGWMPGSETATRGDGQHAEETRSIAISPSSSRSRPDEAGRGRRGRRRPFSPAKPALERAAKARQSGLGGRAHPEASFSATRLRRETAGSGEMQMQIPCPHPRPDSESVRHPDKRLPRHLTCLITNHWRIEGRGQS